MNVKDLVAIDVHTHAEVSCRQPVDEVWKEYEEAASKYFKAGKRPTIAETIAYYREQRIGHWQIAWQRSASGEFRVRQWKTLDETESRYLGSAPAFVDITAAALGCGEAHKGFEQIGCVGRPLDKFARAGSHGIDDHLGLIQGSDGEDCGFGHLLVQ